MKITCNGSELELSEGTVLMDFLLENGYRPQIIAVELNYAIVPSEEYAGTTLKEGDNLEVVSFMGGG